ncbi:MAG: 4Fe-4S dicluster domain-containing protein [candidate division Zixibacteria bacterium]|nr:4Fe-4S dicluster domain-containing protein [candidate division Zixibacteria bacterium]
MQIMARPQRWDSPFDPEMTNEKTDRILSIPPFSEMDPSRFSPAASLRDIIRNDTKITSYQPGDIVVREGDYGNSAFFVLSGTLRVVLDHMPPEVLGRRATRRKGFWEVLAQTWNPRKGTEVRDLSTYTPLSSGKGRRGSGTSTRIFLQDIPGVLNEHRTAQLETGAFFGEIAALGRIPRTATVFADGPAELLEIRWQGLRDLRARVDDLKQHIDRLYRERSLNIHLRETPIFRHLSEEALTEIANETLFETYGNFDWHTSYKTLVGTSASHRLDHEPIIVEEGHYPNGLLMIRAGFARVSERFGNGHRTRAYLGRGQTFGFEEIVHNWRSHRQIPFRHTLRALGYVDILHVPATAIEHHVLGSDPEHPFLPAHLMPAPIETTPTTPVSLEQATRQQTADLVLELLVENRFINGTATMIINLDRCTRCDDCVRACAATHDNNPRFIRHGQQFGRYMVANACMHCADPVCMIGCPTGAIHRNAVQGQVVINDTTCIGCATCANSCPYHNIRMVEIRNEQGAFVLDSHTHAPILKATKCDLCADQITGGPSCQRACPHDALRRIDLHNNPESLIDWIVK